MARSKLGDGFVFGTRLTQELGNLLVGKCSARLVLDLVNRTL